MSVKSLVEVMGAMYDVLSYGIEMPSSVSIPRAPIRREASGSMSLRALFRLLVAHARTLQQSEGAVQALGRELVVAKGAQQLADQDVRLNKNRMSTDDGASENMPTSHNVGIGNRRPFPVGSICACPTR